MPVYQTHAVFQNARLLIVITLQLLLVYSAGIYAGSGDSIVFSTTADRSNPLQNLSNATVSDSIFPFLQTQARVRQVRFLLDGQALRTDKSEPYDVAGGSVSLADPFDTTTLTDGPHTLTTEVYLLAGGGTQVINTSFTVANNLPPAPDPVGFLTPSPSSVDFGEQPVDTESPSHKISFTNSGEAPVTIQGVTITGDYRKVSDNCTDLAVGNICEIRVTFLPTTTGIRSGKLTLSSNAENNPVAVTFSGSGTTVTGTNTDLWVDANNGDNNNSGQTVNSAFRTIQKAAGIAQSGDVIHIMPGVYREFITPTHSGTSAAPIRYVAEAGPGTAILRGSISSSSLSWNRLSNNSIGLPQGVNPSDIYYVDLSAWGLDKAPRFVVELNANGEPSQRLPLAREPDWSVETEWKYHEFWWSADGGNSIHSCDPLTDGKDCDSSSRSETQLIDRTDDLEPAGIELGNLTTLGNLTGSTLVVMDAITGTSQKRPRIISHNVSNGQITVDEKIGRQGKAGLGWGAKYFVENLPQLLDNPGEWWYDKASDRIYLWPPTAGNPSAMAIEISRLERGFDFTDRSYIELDGLTVEFYEGNIIQMQSRAFHQSHGVTLSNVTLRYADKGIFLKHHILPNESPNNKIRDFVIEDSEIAFMDSMAIETDFTWKGSFVRSGIDNMVIRRNELHHLGFGYGTVGAKFIFADQLRFEDNHVHNVSLSGILFLSSVVESSKTFGFSPNEIKTGNILVSGNLFENNCQHQTDCGALKIAGSPPSRHVFRDFLITGNVFRNTFGWTSVGEKRQRFINGMGGRGIYVDNASGIHAYHNVSYNNAFAGYSFAHVWRDGDVVLYNNVAANSLHGFFFAGRDKDTHINVNTQLANNVILNNERGILLEDRDNNYRNTLINRNLYYNNGWNPASQGGLFNGGAMVLDTGNFSTVNAIRSGTDFESNGLSGNPNFWNYNVNDHKLFDGSWPDFHLTSSSPDVLDRSSNLPNSLLNLLDDFGINNRSFDFMLDDGGF